MMLLKAGIGVQALFEERRRNGIKMRTSNR